MLQGVTRGRISRPQLVCCYGVEGCGKSTFASDFPEPIFIGGERGTDQMEVARFKSPATWAEFVKQMNQLLTEKHEFRTLAVDSVDWLEPLIIEAVCKKYGVANIDRVLGGFGKGMPETLVFWREFIALCERLRDERNMNVIWIGHADSKKQSDPHNQRDYMRYTLKLYQKAADLLKESCDCLLFINYLTFVEESERKFRAVGEGIRKIYTERRPGFDAKNRYGLPPEMDLNYDVFQENVRKGQPESLDEVLKRIADYRRVLLSDTELQTKIDETLAATGSNVRKLMLIANRLALRAAEIEK